MWEKFNTKDTFGNAIKCDKKGNLKLILKSGEVRPIGRLYERDGVIVYYKPLKVTFHKTNGIGYAHLVLNLLDNTDELYVKDTKGEEYTIKVGDAWARGATKQYGEFERQLIVPKTEFTKRRKRTRLKSK